MKKMYKKVFTMLTLLFLASTSSFAQSVGINSDGSAPDGSAMLDVKSTNKGFLAPRVSSTGDVTSPATGLLVYQTGGTPGYYYYNGSSWVQLGAASGASQWTTTGSNIYYNTGNVGIGITNPGNILTVEGTGNSNTGVLGLKATGTGAGGGFVWATSAIAPNLAAGNNLIHIIGNDVTNQYNSGYIGFKLIESGSSGNLLTFGLFASDNLMNLNGAGNLGIGNTSPSAKLHLTAGAGNAAIKIDNTSFLEFGAGISGKEGNAGKIAYQLFTADALDIIGAGTDGSNNRKIKFWAEGGSYFNGRIDVAGGAYCNGTTWVNASDSRLKRDVHPMIKYGLKEILELQPVTYYYISDATNHPEVGFIAQEVKKIIPEIVYGVEGDLEKGETLGISYGNLVPVLVKAIQEQQETIETQQKQIEELMQMVHQLIQKN